MNIINFLKIDAITSKKALYLSLVAFVTAPLIYDWIVDNSGLRRVHVEQIEFARQSAKVCVLIVVLYASLWLYSKIVTLVTKNNRDRRCKKET